MKEKVLVIAYYSSYRDVAHAGGKINFYYTNKMIQEGCDVTFIGNVTEDEQTKYQKGQLNCCCYIQILTRGIHSIRQFLHKVCNKINKYNFFDKYDGKNNFEKRYYINNILKKLKKNNYKPSVVILDWIESSFFVNKIKNYFPESKLIVVEQDVYYLNLYRKTVNSIGLDKFVSRVRYKNFKKYELNVLQKVDQVDVLNVKDYQLLLKDGIDKEKIKIVPPYFDLYDNVERKIGSKNILFYGAMNREENEQAVLWFIRNVMPLLDDTYKFFIIGNKPSENLLREASEKIIITGFVEDASVYFDKALCLVVPLLVGAGIKIKVLEGMSAGLPVLTNDIGIEGINAEDGTNFFYCKTGQDYSEKIKLLAADLELNKKIGKLAKEFILTNFNYNENSYL